MTEKKHFRGVSDAGLSGHLVPPPGGEQPFVQPFAGVAERCVEALTFAGAETALVNDLAPPALRGRYNAVFTLSWQFGPVFGPAVAGFMLCVDAADQAVSHLRLEAERRLRRSFTTNLMRSRIEWVIESCRLLRSLLLLTLQRGGAMVVSGPRGEAAAAARQRRRSVRALRR
jgi:MFS family permease